MLKNIFKNINTYIYFTVSLLLLLFGITLILSSVYTLYVNIFSELSEENLILAVLQSTGAIIIAAAITDVAKYMYEEEVLKDKKSGRLEETRRTLTKIIVIISIAVSIEGLIYIFKAGLQDITLLVYPAILIVSSTIMIVGLGIYYKLTGDYNKK